MNITGSVSVSLNQQCNISIVFSNEAGSSEPFILAFGKLCRHNLTSTIYNNKQLASSYIYLTTPYIKIPPSCITFYWNYHLHEISSDLIGQV